MGGRRLDHALARHGYYVDINQAGCAELLTQNPAPVGTCAYAAWANDACQIAACGSLCTSDGIYALNECIQNATAGGCKSYDDAATTACQTTTGPFNKCFVTDAQAGFVNVASTFCGGS